ncbi:MAG: ComEA family DNA-binding protein [Syntrophomonadaceae bacterium]|nr:ComEA family DNA-binding protein [Syntrophomonadaceae bacterium]
MFDIDRRMLAAVVIALLLSFGLGYRYGVYVEGKRNLEKSLTGSEVQNYNPQDKDEPGRIYVYVVGEVLNPGVLELEEGARAFQAVERAKPGEDADLSAINLAAPLRDGEKIVVPRAGEQTGATSSGSAFNGNGLLDLNTATVEELDQKLPGIGPALAQRIVNYRERSGGFRAVEELLEVSGIGEKKYAEIKDLVCVR